MVSALQSVSRSYNSWLIAAPETVVEFMAWAIPQPETVVEFMARADTEPETLYNSWHGRS